jgi:glucose-1-phosphate thymidylyltransferase
MNELNKCRKGIVLAGGSGSRLFPLTRGICKQLLPVYDKPMIYYPLSVLMLSGIQEVLIISTPTDLPILQRILGDDSDFGLRLAYAEQPKPEGLAQAFLIGEAFLAGAPATLILGDNLIFGQDLTRLLASANSRKTGATIFGYRVKNPSAFGVVEFDDQQKVLSIEEKPALPKSHYAVPGLYYYDANVCEMAKQIKPSPRGELEITDLNALYLQQGELHMELFGRGTAWLDMGTHESLHRASVYVESIQSIQGFQIANLEEIAFRKSWITANQLERTLGTLGKNDYTQYLEDILQDPGHKNPNICAA